MDIDRHRPGTEDLGAVVRTLAEWQDDDTPLQLHPGDLGWFWRAGAEAMAEVLRTWSVDGEILALGFLDAPDLLRMTTAPSVRQDPAVTQAIVTDLTAPGRVLPAGSVAVEAPRGSLLQDRLLDAGWSEGERWQPLRRDLAEPVPEPALRIEVVGPDRVADYTAVHRSAFGSPKLTDERWHVMTGGLPFADARSLIGYDEDGVPVAEVTVWSAGPGRPGLLEPLGVHADHRGRGHGRAISYAAAAALREMGSTAATVCTPSANIGGVATYVSAGYQRRPERRDRTRE